MKHYTECPSAAAVSERIDRTLREILETYLSAHRLAFECGYLRAALLCARGVLGQRRAAASPDCCRFQSREYAIATVHSKARRDTTDVSRHDADGDGEYANA